MRKFASISILPLSAIVGMAIAFLLGSWNLAKAEIPEVIAAKGEIFIAVLHAEGAQIYECRANASGALVWQFREPVATLIENGKTTGQHYAGPHWELADGSIVVAKVAARASGATSADIPLLKLEVTKRIGAGRLAEVTTIQRINTKGGVADGSCSTAGLLLSVPYSADYAFYRKEEQELPATH